MSREMGSRNYAVEYFLEMDSDRKKCRALGRCAPILASALAQTGRGRLHRCPVEAQLDMLQIIKLAERALVHRRTRFVFVGRRQDAA